MASRGVDRLRKDVESFQSELMEEFYRNYAGLKDDMSTVEIYDKYAHLFSEDSIGAVNKRMEEEPVPEDLRWLRYLRAFTTMGYLDNAVKVLSDRASTFETKSVVEVDGDKIPYRLIPTKLRNEADKGRRARLFEAKLAQTEKLNEVFFEKMTSLHDLSVVLGYRNYRDLCASVKGIDYKALEEQMEDLLRKTEDIYARAMADILKERAGLELTDAWSYDIPYAFRGQEFDAYFEKGKLVDAFFRTLKGMGIDPEGYPNIHVDIEERPKKTPRAFCAPVRVPDDIKLVIMPTGGWRDYETLFHEGGHAWHFGSTKGDHPAEYRYLGDNSVTEAFAFLFNYLPSNKLWLGRVLGMEAADSYVRFTLVYKLMFLRRYAAKLVYELKLHSGKVSQEFREVYRGCLQKALRFRHTEKHYLEDVDDGFYCAEYLRAWVLEGQLRAALEEEFGEEWFATEKAGTYLKDLWSYGQKFNADEVVKTIGFVDLDVDPLVSEVVRGLED